MARPKNKHIDKCAFNVAYGRILDYIKRNNLTDGTLLPSLTDLAKEIFDGKVKPLRTAMKILADERVVDARRGRGTILINSALANQLLNKKSPVSSVLMASEASNYSIPYVGQSVQDITFSIIEIHDSIRHVWEHLVATFNQGDYGFQVKLRMQEEAYAEGQKLSDVIQCHSHFIDNFIGRDLIQDLSGFIGDTSHFHPNLMSVNSDGHIWGIPLTAVVFLMIGSIERLEKHHLKKPQWSDFDSYIDYVLHTSKMLSGNEVVVESHINAFQYLLSLAGLTTPRRSLLDLDFNSLEVRDFMKRLEQVFSIRRCYSWGKLDNIESFLNSDALIWETHSYALNVLKIRKHYPKLTLIKPPISPNGRGYATGHYICVSKGSPFLQQALVFVNYLNSQRTAEHLGENGVLHGWQNMNGTPPEIKVILNQCELLRAKSTKEAAFLNEVNANILSWQNGQLSLEKTCANIQFHQSKYL